MRLFEIKMPVMGDVGDIVVTDVLVQANHPVALEQPLITVETEMATMQLPSPRVGIVHEVRINVGDKLQAGDLVVTLREASADDSVAGELLPAKVPEIGDPRNRPSLKVIELMVRVGDEVQRGQSLVTLEGDDFLVEVPSEYTGVVREMRVRLRDWVSPGAIILMIEETQDAGSGVSSAEAVAPLHATIVKK
jgi:pyruvate/2-oxoglutarate dehydrogenase complex dihydrolipoamide acyltransferase (E2) component